MPDGIERLVAFVSAVAQTRQRGGHCLALDARRCVLYDCGQWTSEMNDAVARRFPGCAVTVSPLDSSVCGFVVTFELATHGSRLAAFFTVAATVGSLAIVTWRAYTASGLALPWDPPAAV
jgi:hypothetical protein